MIKASEAMNFAAIKADSQVAAITEKFVDLSCTENPAAEILCKKLFVVLLKNKGLKLIVEKARGENIENPAEIQVFTFAPCTSVEVERFFLSSFYFLKTEIIFFKKLSINSCLSGTIWKLF